jgi:photoactive yellow protein
VLTLLSELFDSLPVGVVVLDHTGRVVIYNRAEQVLAGRTRESVLGREFFIEVAPCMNVKQLGGEFAAKIGRAQLDVDTEFSFPFPFLNEPRDVRVKLHSFEFNGVPYGILLVEDVSFARSVDRMKETLQGLLVHDLKNPLSAVVANLGFLNMIPSVRDAKDAAEAVDDALQASFRLNAMLLNLLDITRLETNAMPLARKQVDVHEMLEAVVQDNAAYARLVGATLAVADEGRPLNAWLDAGIVRRALNNLVENATRHSKLVTLRAKATGEALALEVSDDGPGIPEAMRQSIFNKYAQVASVNQTPYNRGLGLTFVKLVARAHGGDVEVECPPTGGTRFRITVPLARSPSTPAASASRG